MWKRVFSTKRSVNPVALAITLVLVTGSILVGVFGTRLPERAIGVWIPLGDVADAARQIQGRMQLEATHRASDSVLPSRSDLADLVNTTIKSEWRPPDLSLKGFVPILAGPAILPGGHPSLVVLYERAGEAADRFLTLFVTIDGGQFASFDDFGRIEPLVVTRSIVEHDDETDPESSVTLVFTDGDLLFLARADDVNTIERVRSELGAP